MFHPCSDAKVFDTVREWGRTPIDADDLDRG